MFKGWKLPVSEKKKNNKKNKSIETAIYVLVPLFCIRLQTHISSIAQRRKEKSSSESVSRCENNIKKQIYRSDALGLIFSVGGERIVACALAEG